jgi:mannose-6-phosphate isomerase-like protein (cupin superfamily)
MQKIENSLDIVEHYKAWVMRQEPGTTETHWPMGTAYVISWDTNLDTGGMTATGCFAASLHDEFELATGERPALIIYSNGLRVLNHLVMVDPDQQGALSYIDGCSNTNLIEPTRRGDPCVNYLHFPMQSDQTAHRHPSARVGMVLKGQGIARLTAGDIELCEGDLFYLPRQELHSFHTDQSTMSLMVWHPDSEVGPTDEGNNMRLRTVF